MLITLIATVAVAERFAYAVTPAGAILGQETLALAAAPAGTKFAVGLADNTVRIFDAKTRALVQTFKGHTMPPRAVAWSPKGDKIASGSENAEIRVWDVKTGSSFSIKGAHIRNINALWFNAQGTKLVSTSDDDTSKVWDLRTRKTLFTIAGKGANIYGTRYDFAGKRIIAGTLGKGLILYNGATGAPAKLLGGHPGQGVNDVDVNVSGSRAATAGRDAKVGIWNLANGSRISYLNGHGDWVAHVKFDPTGQFLASSSTDGTVKIWDTKAMKAVWTIYKMTPTGSPIAWVDGGNFIVTVADDNYLRLFAFAKYKPSKMR